ncbi:hypothetical protein G4956_03995 [Blautia wexlerae]|nr:hypothetical protein [Blautia wexlerae]
MKMSGSLIIGYDFTNGEDNTVLIVGRKRPTEQMEIINAFQGTEAIEMYHKLITPKGEKL